MSRSTRTSRSFRGLEFVVGACLLTLVGCATAQSWELDGARQRALDEVLQSAVAAGDLPGVVVLVTTKDRIVYEGAFGVLDPSSGEAAGTDAVFNIASMTKPITSMAAMMLVDEGRLVLDEPASRYLPELAGREVLVRADSELRVIETRPASREVRVRDLLRHTSGIAYSFSSPELRSVEQAIGTADREAPLVHDPGARWTYGMGTAQVGWIVENVSGVPLEEFLRRRIFEPLGMGETSFSLPAERSARLMALSRRRDGQLTSRKRPVSISDEGRGDGDLISTGHDYARFVQLVLGGGVWRGTRLVSEASIAEMARDQLGDLTVIEQPSVMPGLSAAFPLGAGRDGFGLGFQIAVNAPDGRPDGTLSWAGLYNTHFWIDTHDGIGVLFLAQVLPFYDPRVIDVLRAVERTIYR